MEVDIRRQKRNHVIGAIIADMNISVDLFLSKLKEKTLNDEAVYMRMDMYNKIEFYITREETDEEYNKRIEIDTIQINKLNKIVEEDRYQAYLKLKKIYEPNK